LKTNGFFLKLLPALAEDTAVQKAFLRKHRKDDSTKPCCSSARKSVA